MLWMLNARCQIERKEAVYKMLMKLGYGTQRRIFKYWHSYVNVLYYCASMQMRIALRLWWQAVELGRKAHSALLLFCGCTLRSCMYEWKKLLVTEHHWRGRLLQKWLDVWKYRCSVQRTVRAFYSQFTRGKLHVYFSAMKWVVVYQAEHLRQLSKMAIAVDKAWFAGLWMRSFHSWADLTKMHVLLKKLSIRTGANILRSTFGGWWEHTKHAVHIQVRC